jgi:hypothetical protein
MVMYHIVELINCPELLINITERVGEEEEKREKKKGSH